MTRMAVVLPVASWLFLSGCTAYVPNSLDAIQPGTGVRLEIAPEAAARVRELTRSQSEREVEGWLSHVGADSVFLDVWRTDLNTGGTFRPGLVMVPLTRGDVTKVWERRVSRARTGLLAALLASGAYLILDQALGGAGGGVPTGGGGPDITVLPWRGP